MYRRRRSRPVTVLFMILALAATFVAASPGPASAAGRAVMLVVDTSGSMAGDRLTQAQSALRASIAALPDGDVAGLQSFAGGCGYGGDVLVPPGTGNREALRQAVDGLSAFGGTPTPDALRLAASTFPADASEKVLILVSDGASSCGDPCPVARQLHDDQNVAFTAYTVGFNAPGQAETELACIANATGGQYFPVTDEEGITEAIDSALGGSDAEFDVMTYNVRGNTYWRHEPGGPKAYADVISAQRADIVGLQEIRLSELGDLMRSLGWADGCEARFCSFREAVPRTGEGTAIISRYPLGEIKNTALAEVPGDHFRFLMRVVVNIRGDRIHFYNAHLTNKADHVAGHADEVTTAIGKDARASSNFKYVLVGDLNARPWFAAVQQLSASMIDAWGEKHPDSLDPTVCGGAQNRDSCGFTAAVRAEGGTEEVTPDKRIDFVLAGKSSGLAFSDVRRPVAGTDVPRAQGATPLKYWNVSDHLPVAATLRTAAVNPSGRVHYVGTDRHVHELMLTGKGGWTWTDVTIAAGAGKERPAVGAPDGVAQGKSVQVVHRDDKGHVRLLANAPDGRWSHEDLSTAAPGAAAGKALAQADPQVYSASQLRVVYRGRDNHVHEIVRNGSGWMHSDLNVLAGVAGRAGADLRGDPSGYASPTPRVVYRGTDDKVHELRLEAGGWVHTDLSTEAGREGDVRGDPTGYSSPTGSRVVYRGVDANVPGGKELEGRVLELFRPTAGGAWRFANLHKLSGETAPAGPDPTGYAAPYATVHFTDTNGRVRQLVQSPDGTWQRANLHELAQNPPKAVGRPTGYLTPTFADQSRVVHQQGDTIRELFRRADGSWAQVDLRRLTGAPTAVGEPSPVAVP